MLFHGISNFDTAPRQQLLIEKAKASHCNDRRAKISFRKIIDVAACRFVYGWFFEDQTYETVLICDVNVLACVCAMCIQFKGRMFPIQTWPAAASAVLIGGGPIIIRSRLCRARLKPLHCIQNYDPNVRYGIARFSDWSRCDRIQCAEARRQDVCSTYKKYLAKIM